MHAVSSADCLRIDSAEKLHQIGQKTIMTSADQSIG